MTPLSPADPLAAFRAAVAPAGLVRAGVAPGDAARALQAAPGPSPLGDARAVVVVASGGRAFWERLPADLRGAPHPIDAAGQRAIAAALPALPPGARLLSQEEADRLDLRRLAALAGLGVVSPFLELLLDPEFGPWVSVRGVVAVPAPLPATPPLAWDPCGPCPRPCLDACPAGAYSRRARFDAGRCAAHRLQEAAPARPCDARCHARDACVLGVAHRYGDAEMRHRHRAGLPLLRAWFAPPGSPPPAAPHSRP